MHFRTIIGCWLLLLSSLVHAQDHIVERAWVEDPTGQMGLAQVKALPTLPFTGALSRGYGDGVIWLRLRIDPAARPDARHHPEQLVLRIRPVYLDEVQVFDPLVATGLAGVVGDRHHPREEGLQGADFLQPIARGQAPRDVWLRLVSSSTRQIQVSALNTEDLERSIQRQYLVFSTYVGVVLVLMVWGLTGWIGQRDSMMGAFALKQAAALLFALSSLGFLRLFWPAEASAHGLDQLGNVFSLLAVGAALGFHARFLHGFRPATWAMGLLLGLLLIWGAALALLLLPGNWVRLALQVNMLLLLLGPLVCLVCALSARAWTGAHDGQSASVLPRAAVIGFYGVIVGLLMVASLSALAWAPATEWSIYLAQAHGLITALLLMVLLRYRTALLNRQRLQALLGLERISLEAQHERERREEHEQLLSLLAHEIKVPLSTLHQQLDTQQDSHLELRQAVRDVSAVIDRCIQVSRISDKRLEPRMEPIELTDIVHDAVASCAQPARVSLQAPVRLPLTTDRQLLFVVLNNLLENACKYAPPDSTIELTVATAQDPSRGPCARLELRNQVGPAGGPDPGRVFEKYYRAPLAQRRPGTGLGLYLVLHLTALLGGRVQYRPQAPWLRFEVLLPLTPAWAGDQRQAA